MKNKGNIIPPKEYKNFLVTDPKEMEICDFHDKEYNFISLF